jgi:hypothetical protein
MKPALKNVVAVLAGLIAWIAVVTVINLGLRHGWPAYSVVEKAMTFTLGMMIARLVESAVSSLVSGWVAARIGGQTTALVTGVMLMLLFAPEHYRIWHMFPVWYHLTFLISLPVLSVVGGKWARH